MCVCVRVCVCVCVCACAHALEPVCTYIYTYILCTCTVWYVSTAVSLWSNVSHSIDIVVQFFFFMKIAELKRAISVGRKQVKDKKKLEDEIVLHQIEVCTSWPVLRGTTVLFDGCICLLLQLLETNESLLALEKMVETPKDARVRQLEGSDLSHNELQQKIEDVSSLKLP